MMQEVQMINSSLFLKFNIDKNEFASSINKLMDSEISLRSTSVSAGIKKGLLGKELWRGITPKYLSEYKIQSENLGLRGRIDRIKFEGEVVPFEVKTRAGVYESDKLQLAAYALLLEEEFNKKVSTGVIEHTEGKEEIFIEQALKDKVLEIADVIRKMKDSPEMPSNFNKCEKCFYKQKCFE
ncbi:MAG: CRISPR-associated protein Cas4 [archaeon]